MTPRSPLDHQTNHLYDLWAGDRHLILKEYLRTSAFSDVPLREYRALELLRPLDIAPRPVFVQPHEGVSRGPFVIYDYLEGAMWDRRHPGSNGLAALAEVWGRLHAVPPDGLWLGRGQERPLADVEAHIASLIQAYAVWIETACPAGLPAAVLCTAALRRCHAVVARLLETTPETTPRLCFCRLDARFANVIARPLGRIALVDWEDCGLRDPARDVADLLTHPNQEDLISSAEWQAFLQPYLASQAAHDPHLGHRLELYLALFPLYWLAKLLGWGLQRVEAGQPPRWTVNGLPSEVRLRRYLARVLAWPERSDPDPSAVLDGVSFFPAAAPER